MKTIQIIITISAFFWAACMDKHHPEPTFSLSGGPIAHMSFSAAAVDESYTYTISIYTDDPVWEIAISPANAAEWCIVTPTSGTNGETFTITALPKLDANQRHATIAISVGEERKTLDVIQEGIASE